MSDFKIGTIIKQMDGLNTYEVLERSMDNDACLIKSICSGQTMWIKDDIIREFMDEGKGYIKSELIQTKNRLESIDD